MGKVVFKEPKHKIYTFSITEEFLEILENNGVNFEIVKDCKEWYQNAEHGESYSQENFDVYI